ncbi:hypothetical protein C3B59_09315 [Cryobacterium zongtaii]|uniref:Uncharacterized protein n=1 Tax=Cryobacterium zongtaii TaxID=1259217 RepID=A0A2S3ZEF1_9MICO|nr:hypothetical protein C3B59_09315 [Cryobacterium zongtaii]
MREKKGVELIVPDGTVIAGFEVDNTTYSSQRGAVTTQAAVVVGILYDNINYGGGTFVASTDQGCAGGWVYTYNSLSPYGWNDRASSYKGFSSCRSTVFEGENQSGSQNGPSFNASSLGAMNDKASSYRLAL